MRFRLWGALSGALFLGSWFLPIQIKSSTIIRPGSFLLKLFTHDYICSTQDMLVKIGVFAAMFAIAAVVLGWILHCIIAIILTEARRA